LADERHDRDPVPRRLAADPRLGPSPITALAGCLALLLVRRERFRRRLLLPLVRATFPRYRYDQLMRLGWKVFLPLSLAMVVFYSAVLGRNRLVAGPASGLHGGNVAPASTGVSQ